jgi:hypothetical protein
VGGGGLGDGLLAQTPNPQSPIPNPQSPIPIFISKLKINNLNYIIIITILLLKLIKKFINN